MNAEQVAAQAARLGRQAVELHAAHLPEEAQLVGLAVIVWARPRPDDDALWTEAAISPPEGLDGPAMFDQLETSLRFAADEVQARAEDLREMEHGVQDGDLDDLLAGEDVDS